MLLFSYVEVMLSLFITCLSHRLLLFFLLFSRRVEKWLVSDFSDSDKPGFLSEFDNYIDEISTLPGKLVLLGDFNIHVDTPEESDARHFLTTLATSGLHQHVTGVTHEKGHVLDLVITPEGENHVLGCEVKDVLMSDHYFVDITVNQKHSQVKNVTKTSSNFRKLVVDDFFQDLSSEFEEFPYQSDVDTQLAFYNTTCTKVLNANCTSWNHQKDQREATFPMVYQGQGCP